MVTPAAPLVSLPQIRAPVESVVIFPLPTYPVQFNVPMVIPPDETERPPLNVEVAPLVNWMFPPTTFNPPPVSMPAVPVARIPLLNVEVAPSPLTLITFWIVVDPAIIAEEEALKRPLTWRFWAKVEEALEINPALKVCNAVQVLALPRFNEAITAPVVGEIVKVLSVLVTDETPVVKHEPFLEKQPSVRLKPLFKVEVAPDVNWIFPPVTNNPP